MKGMGRDFMLILGTSVVLAIIMTNPTGTGQILSQAGGTATQLIAALQARPVGQGISSGIGNPINSLP